MGNLEKKLNERNDKVNKIKVSIASALDKEEKKYRLKVKSIEKKESINITNLNKDYSPILNAALMDDLTNDSKIMVERSEYFSLPQEKIDEVLKLKKSISDLKCRAKSNSEIENPLSVLLKYLPEDTKRLLDKPIIDKIQDKVDITSYVSSNGNGCYLLSPVTDSPSDKLSKELEDKILGVINLGKLLSGKDYIYFKGDGPEYINGFLMFNIENSQPEILEDKLIRKLNDEHIQPNSFKEYNMIHRAVPLDYKILKDFMNYFPNGYNIDVQEANSIEKKPKKNIESNVGEEIDSVVYKNFKEQYEGLTQKYGHPLSRTEISQKDNPFYRSIKSFEKQGKSLDFLPAPRNYPSERKSRAK